MVCLIEELRDTTIARWYSSAVGGVEAGPDGRAREANGAATRRRYYHAFLSNIEGFARDLSPANGPSRDHQWRDAVLAAAGAQSASTLYTLTGPRAAGSMLALAREDIAANAGSRRDVMARLGVEVKVWSYWPYRIGWLAQLSEADPHSRQLAVASLIRVLAVWAHDNHRLAATYGFEPPLSAGEDFLVIAAGRVSVGRVSDLLMDVVDMAAGSLGATPHDVFEAVSGELGEIGLAARPTFCELTELLAESLAGLKQLWPRLDGAERHRLHEEFGSEIADLAAIVGGGHGR